MNQKQREFLISHVNKTFSAQKDRLGKTKPNPPSLNNYIIAAFLDGSVEFQAQAYIKERLTAKCLSLGSNNVLITAKDRYSDRVYEHNLTIRAEDFFVLPDSYVAARNDYEARLEEYNAKQEELSNFRDTITMKVQLGSDAVLSSLIEQADNLCDLQLMNAKLLPATKEEVKQLGE